MGESPQNRGPKAEGRGPGTGTLWVIGFLILVLTCLDRATGPVRPVNPRRAACDATLMCKSLNVGGGMPSPGDPRDPGLGPFLQAVIVNRWVHRPSAAACLKGPLRELVGRSAARHGLDGRWVAAVIEAESGFDPGALSEDGAIGLMQLLPETALDLGAWDPWDPVQNIEAGVRYLKALLDRYGGDVPTALAAYNAGPERVDRGRAWPGETRQFVRRVLAAYDRLQKRCPLAPPGPRSIF